MLLGGKLRTCLSELTTQGKARSAVISDLPVTLQVEKSYPHPGKKEI